MRNLTPDMATEFAGKSVEPTLMAELFFDSQTLRFWTGIGNLDYNGNTFTGLGNFVGISPIEETQDIQAKGLVFTLSGIPSSTIALSLNERVRGRPFRLYLAATNVAQYVELEDGSGDVGLEDGSGKVLLENQFINAPYRLFSGLMDYMEFTDNGQTAEIRLSVENILIIGQRTKLQRYTMEDQRKYYPNDKGLEYINQLQDKEVVW